MNKFIMITMISVIATMSFAAPLRKGTREILVEGLFDPDGDNSKSQYGLLAGAGYVVKDNVIVGIYGSVTEADRDFPAKMDWIWGLGVYWEYNLNLDRPWIPFWSSRVGLLDASGVNDKTLLHLTSSLGVKRLITEAVHGTCSVTFHWADGEVFDCKMTDAATAEEEDTDVTLNVGVRCIF